MLSRAFRRYVGNDAVKAALNGDSDLTIDCFVDKLVRAYKRGKTETQKDFVTRQEKEREEYEEDFNNGFEGWYVTTTCCGAAEMTGMDYGTKESIASDLLRVISESNMNGVVYYSAHERTATILKSFGFKCAGSFINPGTKNKIYILALTLNRSSKKRK